MKRSLGLLLLLVLALPLMLLAASGVPMMRALDKEEAKRGDVVMISGDNLGKANVAELYLTNGKDDFKVEITEQTTATLKFKVGKEIRFGRYSLMILTGGETPMFIEQPVKLNIVEQYSPKPEVEQPAVPSESTSSPTQ
ncbi:MAG: hypothetical protein KIT83_12595 [Bryobacterales bacterium]|nr:hypothetical protein [Bryobacterales bacterium]